MSHPIPGHDYGEQTKGESNKEYSTRRRNGMAKSNALSKAKMKHGIHKVADNPSRFVHKGREGDIDLYETWKGGKQSIKRTK